MSCLGIDIGLKTLSMCIINGRNIQLWDTYNVMNTVVCCSVCNRTAKYSTPSTAYCGIHSRKIQDKKPLKTKKIASYSLHEIASKIIIKFEDILEANRLIFDEVTSIILELQPKINQKMKFTSHVLFTILTTLYLHKKCSIKFERASSKLKKINSTATTFMKNTYTNRKKRAVEYVTECLNSDKLTNSKEYLDVLLNTSKRDDLCDSFLLSYGNLKH
jgi:hypothetical protein